MIVATRISELDAVDAFLLTPKSLDGPPPIRRIGTWGGEYTATWNLLDDIGTPVAQIRCRARHGTREEKSGKFLPPPGWKGRLITGASGELDDLKPKKRKAKAA